MSTKIIWDHLRYLFPNHCKQCGGTGVIEYTDDPSPSGVSLSSGYMTYTDPCSCIEHDLCPLCGEASLVEYNVGHSVYNKCTKCPFDEYYV
jgi:hypothetical protein